MVVQHFIRAVIIVSIPILAFAQDNCFEKCNEKIGNDKFANVELSQSIVNGLVGCKAPDFTVTTVKGEKRKLSELRGKVVVLNFWFTSCSPCVAELPALNKLVDEYKGKDVVFIAFGRDDEAEIDRFLKSHSFRYDLVSSTNEFADYYCIVAGWPTNMVIDKKGYVRQSFAGGFVDHRATTAAYDEMKPTIDQYLASK